MLAKKLIYVTGLPRSGSTLLCQLLAHHPEIDCPGHSSPLCPALLGLRHQLSDSDFLLAQLDVDFQVGYQRLLNAFRGFMNGWVAGSDRPWVVDKNRGWLQHLDTVSHLDPDFRMLVCVRELGQIYGSVEAQHQKTLLLDFPDHLANMTHYDRADTLFANKGVIGAPLHAIEALQDCDPALQQRLFYVVFEHLMSAPDEVMNSLYAWLGLSPVAVNWQNLAVKPHESDSYYRYKYRHQTYPTLVSPAPHRIPPRIHNRIKQQFEWFYKTFYPALLG